jgi:hypothetical protein
LFGIKAVRLAGIKDEAKTQFDDEQRMVEQKMTQLGGRDHPFPDADEKGFEIRAFRMSRASTRRTLSFPLLDDQPIEESKKGARVLDERVMIDLGGDDGLVKEGGCRYQTMGLLFESVNVV